MNFGILVAPKIDDAGFFAHMENLGYSHAWVGDSQMLWSDCYATMALGAQLTRTLNIGTGVAIPATRIAPVTAHSIASISRLAPGRTFLGLGTGYTAMRAMGQKPVKQRDFREYFQLVRALLDGEEVEYTHRGHTALAKILMAEEKFVELEHHIPIYFSAFGPKAQGMAGELAEGMISGIPRGGPVAEALGRAGQGAEKAGRGLEDFLMCGLANVMVLEKGESLTSERVLRDVGSAVMVAAHYVYDQIGESGGEPPAFVRGIWKEYLRMVHETPKARRHLWQHRSHYSFLRKEEARFVTEEMVKANCIIGSADEVVERMRELERQGLKHLFFLPSLASQYRATEDFSRLVMARL